MSHGSAKLQMAAIASAVVVIVLTSACDRVSGGAPQTFGVSRVVPALEPQDGGLQELPRWCAGVAETANRVGLLLCSDLEAAMRGIRHNLPRAGAPASTHQRARLLRFAVSSDYAELRQALGLTIST